MTFAGSRVIVLGNSGFVGRHLETALTKVSIPVQGFSSKDLNLLTADSVRLLDGTLRSDDTLVIISALTPDRGRDLGTLINNVRMAENVCAVLKDRPCAHVVYVSSDAVYSDDAHPVQEASCCDPTSFHGLMHLVRERALDAVAKAKSIPYAIVRPCAIYGTGDTHNSYGPNRFVRTAVKEKVIKLFGNGEEQRDHIHIDDVVNVITRCIEQRTEGVLNVATGNAVPFAKAAEIVAEACGGDVRIEGSPRQSPITHRHFDVTRLLRTFPSFRFTPLQDGLTEMVKNER